MIDFSRTYCDLHPNELVTNFCAKGTSPSTQKNAWSVCAPLASAPTPKPTSKKARPPTMKTSEGPTARCKKASGNVSVDWNSKKAGL